MHISPKKVDERRQLDSTSLRRGFETASENLEVSHSGRARLAIQDRAGFTGGPDMAASTVQVNAVERKIGVHRTYL